MATEKQHARIYLADYEIIFKLTPSERAVWLALSYFAKCTFEGETIIRRSWPSQEKLAQLLGCSIHTVRRGIHRLKERKQNGDTIDKDEKIPAELRMLYVKRRAANSAIYILTSKLSAPAILDLSHAAGSKSSIPAIPDHAHADDSDLSHAEIQTDQITKNLTEKGSLESDPRLIRFKLIYGYFAEHSLTQWNARNPVEEFMRIADGSKLNVANELLHVGAYILEQIDQYQKHGGKRRYWTKMFWVSGLHQWLGRKHKSTLDYRRSQYIQKLQDLIPDLIPQQTPRAPQPENTAPVKVEKQNVDEDLQWIVDICDKAKTDKMYSTTLKQFMNSDEFPQSLRRYAETCLQEAEK